MTDPDTALKKMFSVSDKQAVPRREDSSVRTTGQLTRTHTPL